MHRFFLFEKINNYFILDKRVLQHLKLIKSKNDKFICVYQEKFYLTKFVFPNKAEIIEELNLNHEFKKQPMLAIAILKTKAFEFILQKAVELGVAKIIPFYSKNVEQKLGNDIDKKVQRWQEMVLHAAQQSFRNIIPKVEKPIKFHEVLNIEKNFKFIAHEKENEENSQLLFDSDSLFLIGPEGGFTEDEIAKAKAKNFKVISLGKRILRSETAAMFCLARLKENS
ncbi:16S rRNA (uracil(1498)-N(3))-methyltransferase [Mesomycoplasma hyorhinis]|uniref:16S rRNA (uracil(1498)-N(3))-methyltransferase n=1 Tax=Mesomycoplasma hyorhinis TaxID=2100 RepID=UPI001C047921|nr:16S rRNA (uracil(1498)-N(3))-methyltransferase [Mesomycoplasma hyorhinis]